MDIVLIFILEIYFPRNQPNNNKYSTIYEATIHKYVKTISGQRVIYKEFIDEWIKGRNLLTFRI